MRRLLVLALMISGCRCGSAQRPSEPSAPAPSAPAPPASARASTPAPPGVVIAHSPASTRAYIGSPSIAALPDGSYVASHDFFGPGTHDDQSVVYGSLDRGAHWTKLADLDGQWWSTLFVHGGALWILGTSRQFGHVVIRRSSDGGRTWTSPKAAETGLLSAEAGFHCAPVPVVEHDGRLWRAFEQTSHKRDRDSFEALVLSAPASANLLDRASWRFATGVVAQRTWLGGDHRGWLEGNAVVAPGGGIVDVLRVNSKSDIERAAIVHIDADGANAHFDPNTDFVDFPGGSKKFTIRFDPRTKLYWTLANPASEPHPGVSTDHVRNTLALESSPDLRAWTERALVLHHPDREKHAFQHVDWMFDGEDIAFVSRTAFDDDAGGAHTYHDANYLTFHRVERFRDAKLH